MCAAYGTGMLICVMIDISNVIQSTDHSFRGVLPTVARRCVLSSNLVREEAKAR